MASIDVAGATSKHHGLVKAQATASLSYILPRGDVLTKELRRSVAASVEGERRVPAHRQPLAELTCFALRPASAAALPADLRLLPVAPHARRARRRSETSARRSHRRIRAGSGGREQPPYLD
jgi:hypothetical protein